ncbi:DUF664 domain-containing protein [Nakamurella flavida]|uniref:DUF664 domain-containing protein n=1 Tax=Nakamurella flavida TaxID=363630 RepID=A0A939C1B6_9ACTN|nr:DUF664 domain-containing protein [Nakamurella flavida]MBM9475290.1 DUF664 domain-containing protein [Nakamurella flavida]MDP9776864.1 hypothetical protein [Nakamurella flavida]
MTTTSASTPDATPPWEPPLAGSDVEQVVASLDRMRWTFRWKAGGLDAAGLDTRIGASELTLGGLLKHLAFVEHEKFGVNLVEAGYGPPWSEGDWSQGPGWIFTSAAQDTPAELYALWDGEVARARERLAGVLADGDLDQPVPGMADDEGHHPSLRRLLCDLIEEYGRHTGHADLLREAVDGLVGEDPPAGWRP